MQTHFSSAQMQNTSIIEAEKILRSCVHCGFCNATCPTYALMGDELDGPRGRIYLMKNMLEGGKSADPHTVKHLDRCLNCLSCTTTCPSGVNYGQLIDEARFHIEKTYRRPWGERLLRFVLGITLPRPILFRVALLGARIIRPFARLTPWRVRELLNTAEIEFPTSHQPIKVGVYPPLGKRRMRVAMLAGCVQQVLAPKINEATVRLLTRIGCEVVVAQGSGCCGALNWHMGKQTSARDKVRANVAAWAREMDGDGLDAIVINTSGCGTTVKDYGSILEDDIAWSDKAAKIGKLTCDITELLSRLKPYMTTGDAPPMVVAYHNACSLQHGQQINDQPRELLSHVGFNLVEVPEGHMCCGSAGTYSLLQSEISNKLMERKTANIAQTQPDVVASGNVGCIVQISKGLDFPVVHTVELLDWATGGPKPEAIKNS